MIPKPGAYRAAQVWSSVLALTVAAHLMVALSASPSFAASPLQSPSDPLPPEAPEATCPAGGQCFADVPAGNSFYEFVNRIYQQDLVTGYPCGGPGEPCDAENRPYYRPGGLVTRQQMSKFIDNARRLPQVRIEAGSINPLVYTNNISGTAMYGQSTGGVGVSGNSNTSVGVYGSSTSGYGIRGDSFSSAGVFGLSTAGNPAVGKGVYGVANCFSCRGVFGASTSGTGIYGESTSSFGVRGVSDSGVGVRGESSTSTGLHAQSSTGTGVYGESVAGYAGYFLGDVEVTGSCCGAGAGSFRIDHPQDPANKYLYHSAVQSPDMLNVYRGHVTLGADGRAWVLMPTYFEAFNRDFDYQLTPIGAPAPDLHIAREIEGNRFEIAGGASGMKVSWQVTGTRHDPYADAHRIPVEQDKPAYDQGTYLHPTEWGQPRSQSVDHEAQQRMRASMKP